MESLKNELVTFIKSLNHENLTNEVKKRTAFAKVNELLKVHNAKMSNQEIDDLIEEVVSDVSK